MHETRQQEWLQLCIRDSCGSRRSAECFTAVGAICEVRQHLLMFTL
jgi:hypothetical protein